MTKTTFIIPGPLFGYRASVKRACAKEYVGYKERVLFLAMAAGWKAKAISTKEWPVKVSVFVRWKKLPRLDWDNAFKAVLDSIFEQDRYVVPGLFNGVRWDSGQECAEVVIEC